LQEKQTPTFRRDAFERSEAGRAQKRGVTMKYMVVVEKSETGYGAYVPDLPGCVAADESRKEVLRLIKEAIELHIESLEESGEPVPQPSSVSEFIEVRLS